MPAGPPTPSRHALRGLAVLLSFLVAGGPLHARAESNLFPDVYRDLENAAPPKVVVLAVSLDKEADKKIGLLEGITERAVDDSERFQLSPLAFALDPDATKARQQQQLKADQALKDGQKALEDLDAVKALKLADDAIAFAKAGEPATKRGFETYVQAAVMRAASMVANGDNNAAKAEIEKILVFAPKAAFPDSNFPPDLIKHAEATRKKLAAATGTIVVRSEPPGARVHVDGVFRGYAPVTATGFAPGNHLAVAQLGGYQTIAGEIPVDDQTVKLKPAEANSRLSLARDKVKKDPDGPGRDQAARDFGRLLSADQVVLVVARAGLSPGKLELIAERIEVRDGHNDAFRTGSIEPAPEPLAAFVTSALQGDATRDGNKPVAHFGGGGGSGGGGSGRFILGVSLLGVAVLSLGSGIFCGVQASNDAAQYKKTPQVQTVVSANLASEGRTFSIIADISYAIAVLAAAAGTFFLVTSRSKSSSAPPPDDSPPPPQHTKDTKKTELPPPDDSKKKPDDQKKPDDAAAKKKADDDAAAKKKADADAKKAEEEKPPPEKKMTEKERRAEEKRLKAEEKKRAEEERKEEKKRKEDEARQAKEDKKKAEEQKKADEAAKKKADEDAAAAAKRKKSDEEDEAAVAAMKKKKADEDAAKKKSDDSGKKKPDDDAAAKKKADDDAAAKKKADDDAAAAAAAKKKADDDAAAAASKKKADDSSAPKKTDQSSGSKAGDDDKKKKEDQRRKQQQDDEDLKNQ